MASPLKNGCPIQINVAVNGERQLLELVGWGKFHETLDGQRRRRNGSIRDQLRFTRRTIVRAINPPTDYRPAEEVR